MTVLNNPYTLYELNEKMELLDQILDQLTDPDLEMDQDEREQLEEAYLQAFDDLGENLEDKIDAYGVLRVVWENVVENCRAEYQRLAARRRAFENRLERNKVRLAWFLQERGVKKVEGTRFTASLIQGRASVVIDDEYALPEGTYEVVPTIKPDKKEIKRRLDAGEDVPGARLEIGQPTVRIK